MYFVWYSTKSRNVCNFPLNGNNLQSADGNVYFSELCCKSSAAWCKSKALWGYQKYTFSWSDPFLHVDLWTEMEQGSGKRNHIQLEHAEWFHSCRCSRVQIISAKAGINLISKSLLQFSLFTKQSQFQDLLSANLLHLVKNHVPFEGSVPPEIQTSRSSKDPPFGRF